MFLNPFLTFYGELIITTQIDSKQFSTTNKLNNNIIFKDIGRVPSLRPINYDEETLNHLKLQNISLPETYTNNYISNINNNILDFSPNKIPLSEHDVYSMITAVKSINGIAMLRVLPYKHADYKHFGSSIIKILSLPLKDINYENIPLTTKVNQTMRNLKREKMKNLISQSKISDKDLKIDYLIENEEFTHFFELNDLFTIESYSEYGIRHLVKNYDEHNISSTNIINDLKVIFKQLSINNETGYGFNLILTKNYLFVAPLVNPYVIEKGVAIFAEPHHFAGIFTLPLIKAEWPEIIKGEYINFDFAEILRKSTN